MRCMFRLAAAALLAALGIYGVLGYFVVQRSRELGIRRALGSTPRRLFALVIAQGMRPVVIGGALGFAAAAAVARVIDSLLFGVGAQDPVSYALPAAVVGVAALAACTLPAARAMRVDPIVALRQD